MAGWFKLTLIITIVFLALYAFGVINAFWLGMLAAVFIVIGLVFGILLAGTGSAENMGLALLAVGIILAVIIFFFPR